MNVTKLEIPDVMVFEPRVFGDDRGYFFESFNTEVFSECTGLDVRFQQDNHSMSRRGVLRGLHFQSAPMEQGKLVRVVQGEIFDVAVDIRPGSPTFGKWVSQILSDENKKQMWVPEGFAHGFLTLSDRAEVLYKATNFYAPKLEGCLAWDDADIGINWPEVGEILLSEKDRMGQGLAQCVGGS
jgi:dTDP-4-dehydrorhamnose 3,5-epimerase